MCGARFDSAPTLFAACLRDAIEVASGTTSNYGVSAREVAKARGRFASNGLAPMSFRWVCEVLGVDAEKIRRAVTHPKA